ncbi:MAG: phosphoglycerate kinase [Intestinibacillus sp.]
MKKFGIYTLDSLDVTGKTVLLRIDINEPIDREKDEVTDDTRIRGCVPTIRELRDRGAKVVLLAHQGSDIEYKNFYTLRPHVKVLTALLGSEVRFLPDVCGPAAQDAIRGLQAGGVLLLDNVRFMSEEQTLFERALKLTHEQQAKTLVVSTLAPLGDCYVCDAFAAAHRDQPTLCGFEQLLPSAMGRLFEKEYSVISSLMEAPERPCVFVLGGAKIADAFMMMSTVLGRGIADKVLTGGLVANILLAAEGADIGEASLGFIKKQGYGGFIESAKPILAQYRDKIVLPVDLAYTVDEKRAEARVGALPGDRMLVDIGTETAKQYEEIILGAKTAFVNGPMGIFEKTETEYGTRTVWQALSDTDGYTVIGGGDSVTATNKYGLAGKMGYICTGGGALIRFLTGEELPVVRALRHAAEQFPLD